MSVLVKNTYIFWKGILWNVGDRITHNFKYLLQLKRWYKVANFFLTFVNLYFFIYRGGIRPISWHRIINAKYLLPSLTQLCRWRLSLLPNKSKVGDLDSSLEREKSESVRAEGSRCGWRWRKPGQLALLNCAMLWLSSTQGKCYSCVLDRAWKHSDLSLSFLVQWSSLARLSFMDP